MADTKKLVKVHFFRSIAKSLIVGERPVVFTLEDDEVVHVKLERIERRGKHGDFVLFEGTMFGLPVEGCFSEPGKSGNMMGGMGILKVDED